MNKSRSINVNPPWYKTRCGPEETWPDGHCYEHGSDSDLRKERRKQGLCEWHNTMCRGEIKECEYCGYYYCEYHMSCHFR